MQPTYLPWAGYLNLVASVDAFILLDDAQYERASWQNRNRILVAGAPSWLTVPVVRDHLGATLNTVATDQKVPWRKKHVRTIQQAYARSPFRSDLVSVLEALEQVEADLLAEINIALLNVLCGLTGIRTPMIRSSEMGIAGKRTSRLIRILEHVGCTEYVTTPGALTYLCEDRFQELTRIPLLVQRFIPQPYGQHGTSEFVSHLSTIDIVANLGWRATAEYVCRNPRWIEAYRPEEGGI